jgi:hypothetical protein
MILMHRICKNMRSHLLNNCMKNMNQMMKLNKKIKMILKDELMMTNFNIQICLVSYDNLSIMNSFSNSSNLNHKEQLVEVVMEFLEIEVISVQ